MVPVAGKVLVRPLLQFSEPLHMKPKSSSVRPAVLVKPSYGKKRFQGKKKHININKFAGLSRDWVGAKILFMCFFLGSFLMGEKNT